MMAKPMKLFPVALGSARGGNTAKDIVYGGIELEMKFATVNF
jgi:hypothetical protein